MLLTQKRNAPLGAFRFDKGGGIPCARYGQVPGDWIYVDCSAYH